jgi:hypothetical protein
MNLGPDLWRNMDGTVVVSTLIPRYGLPGNYDLHHRPATPEDLRVLTFLKPEHDEDPLFE